MMKRHLFHLSLGMLFFFLTQAGGALAVEVAPRISDREIIERLGSLENGLERIERRMDAMQKHLEQRMDAMQKHLEQRMGAMQKHLEQRMDTTQKHQEQRMDTMQKYLGQRMDAQWNLMLVIIGGIFGLITGIFGLIGFVVWDRKTAMRPLEQRFAGIARELERDLDTASPKGSRLTRLISAVREFAPDDPRLAKDIMEALKRHSLLDGTPEKA
uniref:Uncharacterized protein n=1 Tax=Candidatus Kentrum sp. DK TaxID=2126562 RepID=A0A450RXD8_9GAMM|nr:MAG: hypothetical protein BECKDK2373C_GA0170839_100658 [Candidatus Kentron sp. DK]